MARKKKKLARKKLKQQRREIIARKRQERGWAPPKPVHSQHGRDEVVDDIQPLLKNTPLSSRAGVEELLMILMDSSDLIEEPEFEEIIIDPMLCIDTFIEVGEELGIGPSSFDTLPDEDVDEDQHLEMLETTVQRVLTEEVRQEIVDGLNNLRLRLKQSGKPEETARVAALQSFLRGDAGDEILPRIGLVQALVHRSLEAGFAVLEASTEVMDILDTDNDTPLTFLQKFRQSGLAQKAEGILKKVPGLGSFLEKQADDIWEEGKKALYQGDLYLELFTEEELAAGFEIFQTAFIDDIDVDKLTPQTAATVFTKEKLETFVYRVKEYVTELFTPERLEQLRTRLNSILDDPDFPNKWSPFIIMLLEYVADDDIGESEKLFLAFTFMGEFSAVNQAMMKGEE